MSIPKPEQILSIRTEKMGDFIQYHAATKTLSRMVRHLNRDLMAGDATAQDMAARALRHMGFPIHA